MVPLLPAAKSLRPTTRLLAALRKPNYTSALALPVSHLRDFLDTVKCGRCSKLDGDELENLRTASVCSVELPAQGCVGCGTAKIMSGPRSTASIKSDGSTLILVKRFGTIHASTPKVRNSNSVHQRFVTDMCFFFRLESQNCLLHRLLQRRCYRRHPPLCPQFTLSTGQDPLSRGSPPLDHTRTTQDSPRKLGQTCKSKVDAGRRERRKRASQLCRSLSGQRHDQLHAWTSRWPTSR
jgi:hypothetical protein